MKSTIGSCRKMLLLVLGVMLLSLSGCATPPVRDVSSASDLEMMRLGVHALTKPRQIAGKYQHLDEATTTDEAYTFGGNAEEAFWLSERDKAGLKEFVDNALDLIAKSRRAPCPRWKFWCKE